MISSVDEVQILRKGRKLVFTNGVFDILHAGHVTYLERARALGDLLVVGLNSDDSAKSLGKGPNRPVNHLVDRVIVVGALRCVDAVLSFDEPDPSVLIAQLRPDIHVKGGDYNPTAMPETKIVEEYGGEVVILPLLAGRSTTTTIKKILDLSSED